MTPFPHFILTGQLALLGYLVLGGVVAWFAADMRFILLSMQRKNQLAIEGQWAELEQHLERASNTRRPFAWFLQRYLLPGSCAAQFALFLFEQGRLEQALSKVDQAIKQIENKPTLFRPVFQRQTNGVLCGALMARVPPARWIRLAGIYMAQEALEKADGALDEAKKLLGSNPVLQISYWRARARNFAAQGKSAEADDCVARARAMIKQFSPRSTVMETHLAIGRSYLSLRRCGEALTELAEAQRFSLHPVEKHQVAYWIGRTHEAAGNPSEAIAYYQKVASDNIPSWMRSQAAASVTKLTAKIPPLPSSGPPATD